MAIINQNPKDYYRGPDNQRYTRDDNYGNFLSVIRERNKELLHSMNTETSTFPEELIK